MKVVMGLLLWSFKLDFNKMDDKYKNKYRIPSSRHQNWDYSSNGAYFITICTKNRMHHFGYIKDGIMYHNEIGLLAEKYWAEIPNHFNNVTLGNFQIMPNHTHGILIINNLLNSGDLGDSINSEKSQDISKSIGQLRFQNQGKNTISSMIGSFKSIVTKNAKIINPKFGWQTRFHDHIIRDSASFERIQNYIANNPKNWKEDTFNNV
jgi:putative transposase